MAALSPLPLATALIAMARRAAGGVYALVSWSRFRYSRLPARYRPGYVASWHMMLEGRLSPPKRKIVLDLEAARETTAPA